VQYEYYHLYTRNILLLLEECLLSEVVMSVIVRWFLRFKKPGSFPGVVCGKVKVVTCSTTWGFSGYSGYLPNNDALIPSSEPRSEIYIG